MKRRDFLQMLAGGAAAVVAGPLLASVVAEDPPYPLKTGSFDLSGQNNFDLNRLLSVARGRNTNNAVKRLLEYAEAVDLNKGYRRGEFVAVSSFTRPNKIYIPGFK